MLKCQLSVVITYQLVITYKILSSFQVRREKQKKSKVKPQVYTNTY